MPLKSPTKMINWPRGVHLSVYDENKWLVELSEDRQYDLNDELFQSWGPRVVYLEVQVNSKNWRFWDSESLRWIENRIRWDLEFDANEFYLRRYTRKQGQPCTEGFIWKIDVR